MGCHHCVIGIVDGRLKESFNRPAIVIGIDEFGVGKGSGRSIAGVDLGRAIMDAVLDKKLVGGGGHVMACGLTIDPEKVQVFREYLNSKIGEQSSKARQENARSEEQTSELQSLMRISYAVFCLKKKKDTKKEHKNN